MLKVNPVRDISVFTSNKINPNLVHNFSQNAKISLQKQLLALATLGMATPTLAVRI